MRVQQTEALLRLLLEADIEHVIVGGVASLAWGALELTRDLDIVIPFSPQRIATLLEALAPHQPKHATRTDLGVIRDSPDALAKFRILLIETDLGRIDVLPGCEPVGDYARLLETATSMRLDDGEHMVVGLEDLIAIKEHVARPKDLLVAAQLKAVRARLRVASGPESE